MGLPSIGAVLRSLREASNAALALSYANDSVPNDKLATLKAKILDAREAAAAADDEFSELIETVYSLEDWDHEKDRYRLIDIGLGVFTYIIRNDKQNDDPIHCLCANCFNKRIKVILQKTHDDDTKMELTCSTCGSSFQFDKNSKNFPFRDV